LATTRIEYAVAETADLEIQVLMGTDRERAFKLAERWNNANPGSAIVMNRTVTTTDWQPANTGIVPPYMREKKDE